MVRGAMPVLKVKRFEAKQVGALRADVAAYIARQPAGAVIEQGAVSSQHGADGPFVMIVKVWLEPDTAPSN
jgi:hypothetical protein